VRKETFFFRNRQQEIFLGEVSVRIELSEKNFPSGEGRGNFHGNDLPRRDFPWGGGIFHRLGDFLALFKTI